MGLGEVTEPFPPWDFPSGLWELLLGRALGPRVYLGENAGSMVSDPFLHLLGA